MSEKSSETKSPLKQEVEAPILINGKEYEIPIGITVELYEKIIPIIDKLDQNQLRSSDLKLGEVAKMLASVGALKDFVSVVLGAKIKDLDNLPFDTAMRVCVNFFMKNATSMILSGIFYMEEQEVVTPQTNT